MPLYDKVKILGNITVDGKLTTKLSINRKTKIISDSSDVFATEMFETVIFTTTTPIIYNLPAGTEDLDGTTSTLINGGGGEITIRVTTTIDGNVGVTDLVLLNVHDRTTLRYVHSNTTWYII